MRDQFQYLFDYDADYFYLKVMLVVFILFKLVSIRQSSVLTLHYSRASDGLMKDFVEKSKISKLAYRPYWFCLNPFLQTMTFLGLETFYKYWYQETFDRETVMTEDGGTLGIDWAYELGTNNSRPSHSKGKPILLLAPGLGGGSDNLYTVALLWAARKSGFKVGTMLFRGAQGLPITSNKLSYAGAWRDCKTIVEFVHKKYQREEKKQRHNVRMYAYGCSLGAQILGLYLRRDGQRVRKLLDGCVFYGTPWSA